VGKTSLINRFVHDRYSMNFVASIGIDYKYKSVLVHDHDGTHRVRLVLWDTAGQERFRTITRQYYRGAQGVVLVYDTSNRATFENVDNWLTSIEQSGSAESDLVVALVANKTDLSPREVSADEGEALAERRGAKFFYTSAKQNNNVSEIFIYLTKEIERRLRDRRDLERVQHQYQNAPSPTEETVLNPAPILMSRSADDSLKQRRAATSSSCCGVGDLGVSRNKTRPYSYPD